MLLVLLFLDAKLSFMVDDLFPVANINLLDGLLSDQVAIVKFLGHGTVFGLVVGGIC